MQTLQFKESTAMLGRCLDTYITEKPLGLTIRKIVTDKSTATGKILPHQTEKEHSRTAPRDLRIPRNTSRGVTSNEHLR